MLNKRFFIYIKKILFFSIVAISFGCAEKTWKDHGDSCIITSENPPLKRVINYTDYDLCDRQLKPRVAPNPKTRIQN